MSPLGEDSTIETEDECCKNKLNSSEVKLEGPSQTRTRPWTCWKMGSGGG
jgi:hypothetical protein